LFRHDVHVLSLGDGAIVIPSVIATTEMTENVYENNSLRKFAKTVRAKLIKNVQKSQRTLGCILRQM